MVDLPARGINMTRKKLKDGTERVYYYHRATNTRLLVSRAAQSF